MFSVDGQVRIRKDGIHLRSFGSEVEAIALDDAERIDPKVGYFQFSANCDCIGNCLREFAHTNPTKVLRDVVFSCNQDTRQVRASAVAETRILGQSYAVLEFDKSYRGLIPSKMQEAAWASGAIDCALTIIASAGRQPRSGPIESRLGI